MSAAAPGSMLALIVPPDAAGQRLDRFLAAALAGTSRAALRRWIDEGRVLVEDRPATKAGLSLRAGMRLAVRVPEAPARSLVPESLAFTVLHEDAEIVVVDKPAGLVMHPGHGLATGTLVHGLLGRGIALAPHGAPDRPGVVHRLDRGTSGVVVLAKTDRAHAALARAFARREVRKTYLALVWGHPAPASGRIDRSIGRSRRDPTRMAVRDLRGRSREAASSYRTLESLPGFAWLEVRPETGRTHQIRVHLESLHHPIVGDERYGGRRWRGVQEPLRRGALRDFRRLALHASRLELRHPADGRERSFEAPVPAELARLLAVLRERR